MKAAQLIDYGPADNFRIVDVPRPDPKPGEVLIRTEFAGLRWGDIMGRNGIPVKANKPPFTPGQESAGVVAEVGEGVTRFKPGDRVVAQPAGGAFAEYVATPAGRVGHVPAGVGLDQALVYRVNMPVAYMLAFEWGRVAEGESVIVHAAAGGVGMLAVQVLKRRFGNVTVIGVAGGPEKAAAVLANGADHAIDRKAGDYVAQIEALIGARPRGFAPGQTGGGVHVVMNGVGGETLKTDRLLIRPLGRWVLFGTPAGAHPVNLYAHSYDSITVMPFSIIPFAGTPQMERAQAFTREWQEREPLITPIAHPLDDIAAVQQAMEDGRTHGKIVFKL
jgi:NADPH2:quinone reductase